MHRELCKKNHTMELFMVRLVSLILLNLISHSPASSLQGPGLTPNRYTTPGDVHLGVLHTVLHRRPNGSHCSLEDNSVFPNRIMICEGSVYAAQEINKRDDILPNITLGLVCTDSCATPLTALGRVVNLVDDSQSCTSLNDAQDPSHQHTVGIIGPGYSRVAVVVSPFLSLFQIPLLGTFASSDELSDNSEYEYFMRLIPPDRFQAQAFIDLIIHFNWTYVGLMYSEGSYGEHGAKYITELVASHHLCLAFSQLLSVTEHVDEIDRIINILEEFRMAKAVVWFVEGPILARFLKAFETLHYIPQHIMLLSDSGAKEAISYPHAVQGSIAIDFVFYPVPGFDDYLYDLIPTVNTTNPWLKMAWEKEFQCSWSPETNNSCHSYRPPKTWYGDLRIAMQNYEAVYVYAHTIHSLITMNCPEAFQKKTLLKSCIRGPDLLTALKQSSINKLSGPIIFDENGDRLARYQLYHYYIDENDQQVRLKVATWEKFSRKLDIQMEKLQWSHLSANRDKGWTVWSATDSGAKVYIPDSVCSRECAPKQYKLQRSPHCCWECRWCRDNEVLALNKTTCASCPEYTWPDSLTQEKCQPIELSYIHWGDTVAVCLICSSVTGTAVTLIFIVIFFKFRFTKLVKASNKELSFLMLAGVQLAFLLTMAFLVKPTRATCYIRDIGFNAVVTLIYAPLLVKTLKIYVIFSAGKKGQKTPRFVNATGQRIMTAVAIIIQAIILVAVEICYQSDTKLLMPVLTKPYVELTCRQSMASFLLPLSYNVIFICICGLLGYGSRKLPENFNESGFIFVSVSTTFFAWVVFLPTYFTAYSTKHQAMILALCLLLNGFITVICLFAPKVYAIFCVEESALKFTHKASCSMEHSVNDNTVVNRIQVQPYSAE